MTARDVPLATITAAAATLIVILAALGAVSFTRPYAVLLSNDGRIGEPISKD